MGVPVVGTVMKKVFGTHNERMVKRYLRVVDQVSKYEPEIRPLTDRDMQICEQIGPVLRDKGLLFAGIDVIGDFLTEINVTSPTGIRELERASGLRIAEKLCDAILLKLE